MSNISEPIENMAQHVMEARKNYGSEKIYRNINRDIVCEVNDNFPLVQLPLTTSTMPTTSKMVQMRAWLKTQHVENDSVSSIGFRFGNFREINGEKAVNPPIDVTSLFTDESSRFVRIFVKEGTSDLFLKIQFVRSSLMSSLNSKIIPPQWRDREISVPFPYAKDIDNAGPRELLMSQLGSNPPRLYSLYDPDTNQNILQKVVNARLEKLANKIEVSNNLQIFQTEVTVGTSLFQIYMKFKVRTLQEFSDLKFSDLKVEVMVRFPSLHINKMDYVGITNTGNVYYRVSEPQIPNLPWAYTKIIDRTCTKEECPCIDNQDCLSSLVCDGGVCRSQPPDSVKLLSETPIYDSKNYYAGNLHYANDTANEEQSTDKYVFETFEVNTSDYVSIFNNVYNLWIGEYAKSNPMNLGLLCMGSGLPNFESELMQEEIKDVNLKATEKLLEFRTYEEGNIKNKWNVCMSKDLTCMMLINNKDIMVFQNLFHGTQNPTINPDVKYGDSFLLKSTIFGENTNGNFKFDFIKMFAGAGNKKNYYCRTFVDNVNNKPHNDLNTPQTEQKRGFKMLADNNYYLIGSNIDPMCNLSFINLHNSTDVLPNTEDTPESWKLTPLQESILGELVLTKKDGEFNNKTIIDKPNTVPITRDMAKDGPLVQNFKTLLDANIPEKSCKRFTPLNNGGGEGKYVSSCIKDSNSNSLAAYLMENSNTFSDTSYMQICNVLANIGSQTQTGLINNTSVVATCEQNSTNAGISKNSTTLIIVIVVILAVIIIIAIVVLFVKQQKLSSSTLLETTSVP